MVQLDRPDPSRLVLDEGFDGDTLDETVWLPHYLPAWSSLEQSRATFAVTGSHLELSIPPAQAPWCADDHTPLLRVSGVQSGNLSGPAGSTRGQQPYRDGLLVREEQRTFVGHAVAGGRLEVRARMELDADSMAAFWLVGLEDQPRRSAEICVAEVFGRTVTPDSADVGAGVHAFRDPTVTEDFAAVPVPIDVRESHDYAVDWTRGRAVFAVDGQVVRETSAPPTYPMQLMVAVFDFAVDRADGFVPRLLVDHVRTYV
ncbi:glycoside hydrolase family 16 protein [Aeromicrobium sp. IC_218]|uniref:glycoside hydrolase family 16 protein n=1 Tax=Aeromicrobium sp. IC_218 TaxID=2545468 RepID=UPI001F608142|nr:glycoside hydrolase family 16 protein [Aeromicrobium sp. IC_218]